MKIILNTGDIFNYRGSDNKNIELRDLCRKWVQIQDNESKLEK